ncbi:hypothetical protein COXBURSA334_0638 [Coxiella burnetii Q321]|nr:hypothetical protein COXBURSA334_0638 [Coxiella burnetii Q321]
MLKWLHPGSTDREIGQKELWIAIRQLTHPEVIEKNELMSSQII